jgi:heterodisulfide reductase subunit C2
MDNAITKESLNFAQVLQDLTGENVLLCDQCGKCTHGCPTAYAMRMKPHELMEALKLGMEEKIFWSGAIWICVSCEGCKTRCPHKINVLRIINGLRELSLAGKAEYYNPYSDISMFHRLFITRVARYGRLHELSLGLLTNLKILAPFKDIDLAISMLKKGKLKLFPSSSRGVRELRKVMARVTHLEKGSSPVE